MSAAAPIVRADGEGPRRWFSGGGTHTWKVTNEEAGGAFFMFEDELTQGKMTPLHCHPEADETVFVLAGEILVNIDGSEHKVETGGVTLVPRGVAHAFTVRSLSARLLTMQTPGAAGSFYWNASDPAGNEGQASVDLERVRRVAQQDGGTQILGPPPFQSA